MIHKKHHSSDYTNQYIHITPLGAGGLIKLLMGPPRGFRDAKVKALCDAPMVKASNGCSHDEMGACPSQINMYILYICLMEMHHRFPLT